MEISDDRECVAHHCHLNIRHPKMMKRKRRIEKKTCRTRRRKGRQIQEEVEVDEDEEEEKLDEVEMEQEETRVWEEGEVGG